MTHALGSMFIVVSGLSALMGHPAEVTTANQIAPNQPPDVYEVVSVKPSGPSDGPEGAPAGLPGGRFEMVNMSVDHLLAYAFRVTWQEIYGIPSWVRTDRYTVRATAVGNATPAMARNMLASRFKLRAHYEQRPRPAYVLTVARKDGVLGPGLVRLTAACEKGTRVRFQAAGPGQGDEVQCGFARVGPGLLQAVSRTFPQIVSLLSNAILHRRVVDRTALQGYFDANFAYRSDPSTPDGPLSPSGAPPLPIAMEEQLGLKVKTEEVPTTVLVVEHIERPTED